MPTWRSPRDSACRTRPCSWKKPAEFLPAKLVGPFAGLLASLTRDNLSRMEKDIEWFTLKFDYRNQDKPWGDSKDAVERTVNKLRGWCVGAEPTQGK